MKKQLLPVICGILAMLLVGLYLNSLEMSYKKGAEKAKVLVARQYIDQGTMIDSTMVEEAAVPKSYIQPKAIQSVKDLASTEGRKIFMSVVPIEKGEQIVTTKLSMLGLDTGISMIIPTERRGMTVLLEKECVAGVIKPGNRVDVIAVVDYENKDGRLQEAAATILQNILVLSTGKSILGISAMADSPSRKTAGNDAFPEFPEGRIPVSLSVNPQEAELLALATEKGVIKFSLRPIGDEHITVTQGTKVQDMFKDVSVTAAGKNNDGGQMNNLHVLELQKKQKEALELLKKYQKG